MDEKEEEIESQYIIIHVPTHNPFIYDLPEIIPLRQENRKMYRGIHSHTQNELCPRIER